jgi:hypothetical protein
MIVRSLMPGTAISQEPEGAWPTFQGTQRGVSLPCFVIPQAWHAELAGVLAERLRHECFGRLPPDVLEAIRTHDIGWRETDAAQLARLRAGNGRPASFTEIAPEESVPAWRRSIRHAEGISVAAGIIVSRHFCSLATDGGDAHRAFHEEETKRREPTERAYPDHEELMRWFGALGVCDLMSLVLCSGTEQKVNLPLAHPNMPKAVFAPRFALRARNGTLWVEGGLLEEGDPLVVEGWLVKGSGLEETRRFEWRVTGERAR